MIATDPTDTDPPPEVDEVCDDCGYPGELHTHHTNPMCRFEADGFCYCPNAIRCSGCCPCEHAQ